MRYEYKCILILLKISLKPLYMVGIQIVCRLVKQKYLWLLKQQFSQQDFGPLSARQLSHILVKSQLHKIKCPGNLLNLGIYYIEIMAVQKILQKSHLLKQRIHLLIIRHICKLVTDLIYPFFHVKQSGKCVSQHSSYSHARLKNRVLVQIANLDILRPRHRALIGHQLSSHYVHKCRLALTIRTDKSYVLARKQPE